MINFGLSEKGTFVFVITLKKKLRCSYEYLFFNLWIATYEILI